MEEENSEASSGALPNAVERARRQPPVIHVRLGPQFVPMTPDQQAAMQALDEKRLALAKAGLTALNAGQYIDAEAIVRQALALTDDHGFFLFAPDLLAAALAAQGKDQEALEAYQALAKAGSVDPRELLPYALLLVKTGQWAQAVSAYDKQLPYFTFGDLRELTGENSHFTAADPEPTRLATAIHAALGLTYAPGYDRAGNSLTDRGLSHHRQALALDPDSAIANYCYGYSLRRIGRQAEAKVYFQKAADLDQGAVKRAAEEALKRG